MVKRKFTPTLRFPKFESAWDEKTLGELGTFLGGGTPSTKNIDFWEGDIPWVSSSDLSDENIYSLKTSRFITNEAILQSATKLIPEKSILIVSRVGVGKVVVNDVELCTSQDFTNLIPHSDNYLFLAYLIKFKTNRLLEFNQGTSIKGFVKSDLETLKVSLPSLPEQQKIASFLTSVDERIQQLTRKKKLLEQYKKGVMQKIFSREIRFKDDKGKDFPEWEEKQLGEIGEFKNGINKSKEDFGFGVPFINLMDVFGKSTISDLNLDLVNANEKEIALYELKKGDVLFIRSSVKKTGVGETSLVLKDLKNTVYSGFLIRFRDNKIRLDLSFKKYCFSNKKFREDLISLSTTSANTNINQESLSCLEISLPSLDEQEKISSFLTAIDQKIILVNIQLHKTQAWKKGLLQKMFV